MRKIGVGTFRATPLMREYVNDVLDTGRISYGPYSRELETKFSSLHRCKYGVLSNSGTSSLQVALQAMKELHGWKDGTEVLVPAVTFVATVNIVLHNRMKPILVDVEPEYYGMSPVMLHRTAGTLRRQRKAVVIIPAHLFGHPCKARVSTAPYRTYGGIAGYKVIEDSCETMLATIDGNPVGSMGDIGCFSMYVAHLLTAGVGGISITSNPDYAAKMRSLVNHGRSGCYMSIDDDEEFSKEIISKRFHFESIGHSYRITELEAAIALSQLDDLEHQIRIRQRNAKYLTDLLEPLDDRIQLPRVRPGATHSWMMYPLVMRNESKWPLVNYLEKRGVETREMMRLTDQPCYKGLWNPDDYPVAAWINRGGFYLGCHQDLDLEDMAYIATLIHDWVKDN